MNGHEHKVIPKKRKNKNVPQEHKHDNNLELLVTVLIIWLVWSCAQLAFPLSLGLNANVKATLEFTCVPHQLVCRTGKVTQWFLTSARVGLVHGAPQGTPQR